MSTYRDEEVRFRFWEVPRVYGSRALGSRML